MTILVCPLSQVDAMVAEHSPDRVISVLDPGSSFPELGDGYSGRHLRLSFHDVHEKDEQYVRPAAEHVGVLLGFLKEWERPGTLLIHCRAGISRSTAVAFIAACFVNPDLREHDIAVALRAAGPLSRPNRTVVRLADREMGRAGRMSEAIEETGRDLDWVDVEEGVPFSLRSLDVRRFGTDHAD